MEEKFIKISLGIIASVVLLLLTALSGFLLWSIFVQVKADTIKLLQDTEPQKTQAAIDAEKRDDCLENGFDYEFVEEFWYTGVRCVKPNY